MSQRTVRYVVPAQHASDGAGVKLKRLMSGKNLAMFDPFLMLDEFNSNDANDYIAGFPSHPHRGFETVTYMLDGKMLHEDHLGNQGLLNSGDVQWMTAAHGIIHSEMPQQEEGLMRGFQLWLNLPADEKLKPPSYRDIPSEDIPVYEEENVKLKVIAGNLRTNANRYAGLVTGISTDPTIVDLRVKANSEFRFQVNQGYNVLLYVFDGNLTVEEQNIEEQHMAILSDGEQVTLKTSDRAASLLVLIGKPLREPIVQWGPFVMNTPEQIEQAIQDYRSGVLTQYGSVNV
ncbi:pirin family protein [Pleionea litopenaei]|uniref:Pirin family protein n=1 Tax=Pleionea litopenaei TaxID=3070815 RepID=A0AA51X5R9_9GAMM|nr:pirin family protein [Pleionea sp. HL-JVS1]WMS86109.1 pirin family protein [Pleionea sp. HL-JVS1]